MNYKKSATDTPQHGVSVANNQYYNALQSITDTTDTYREKLLFIPESR